jgi:hydroxyacylglutathione hydrolase
LEALMQIQQFRYNADNFGYLVYGEKDALAIDGGAVKAILEFINHHNLELKFVTTTHGHMDHTQGSRDLLKQSSARLLSNDHLQTAKRIELDSDVIQVIHTPGHTLDSLTFHFDNILVTGDTLFNGTVGNCFSGDLKAFYDSIKRLLAFDDNSLIYAGHDYVKDSMAAARRFEPDNTAIDSYLDHYDSKHVVSNLGQERVVNPYLRFNEPSLIDYIKRHGMAVETEYERWCGMMQFD